MSYEFVVHNSAIPDLGIKIGVPDKKANEIRTDDAAAINFARSVVSVVERVSDTMYCKTINDLKFTIRTDEQNQAMKEITNDFMLHGTYEPQTTRIVQENVKEGDTCVDIGASIGYFSMLFARLIGDNGQGIVYSFEPTSNQFAYLVNNIKLNGFEQRIKPYNFGAWSSESYIELKTNELGPKDVMALDTILPKKVDFIKIDCDGAEPEILKGLEQTIINNPQLKLMIEYYPAYIEKMNLNPQEMLDFLNKYFTLYKVEGDFEGEQYWNYYCIRKV